MIRLFTIILLLLPSLGLAQTRTVDPDDLTLTITLEETEATPFQREMLLLTIHGVYQRHITLEKLEQPDLAGLNWMQLGQDHWFESKLDGKTVKNMRRRMAIFPDVSGRIEIGAFKHHLTLLDENNAWFEHTIQSDPVTLDVDPAPAVEGWWFPVRDLKISDDWSNAPDQLAEGEGVLRVIRLSALGASPDMIPPMPKLISPSALIFPHPEKRLVDLTPRGPVSIAFWRWTIQPRNGVSAILEPIEFSYFDTVQRQNVNVSISAQRIAYLPGSQALLPINEVPSPTRSRPLLLWGALLLSVLMSFGVLFGPGRAVTVGPVRDWLEKRRMLNMLRDSSRQGDLKRLRRTAHQLDRAGAASADRTELLDQLDHEIYGRSSASFDPSGFYRRFVKSLRPPA